MSSPSGSAVGHQRTPLAAALGLGAGLALVAGGQALLLSPAPLLLALLPWVGGLALVTIVHARDEPATAHTTPLPWPAPTRPPWTAIGPLVLLALSAAGALGVVVLMPGRAVRADYTPIALMWLVAMASLVGAASWRARLSSPHRERVPATRAGRWEWWSVGVLLVVAFLVRVVGLERYPSIIDADGMAQALEAVDVRLGIITNPFSTGFFGNPLGFVYAQRVAMDVVGETLLGSVALNVVLGTTSVLFTYLLARRWWGAPTALVAAALLTTLHGHVHFSRTALNVLADGWFLIVALWLLDIGIAERKQWACALAGIAVGLSQYFYVSARVLVPLLLTTGAFLLAWRWRSSASRSVTEVLATATWMVAGFAIAYLPLGINYLEHPETFAARIEQVSILSGWLEEEAARTGASTTEVLARQAGRTALLPFETTPIGPAFHPPAPLVGWAMAVPVVEGLAMVTARPWRRRQAGLALAWWGVLAGIGFTVQMTTPRWTIAWPMVALLGAAGLAGVGRVLVRQVRVPASAVASLGVLVVGALMAWNVATYFRPSNELTVYGDVNSLVASELAWRLEDEPFGTVVYMATAPRMTFRSHATLRYLAPQVVGIDLLEPVDAANEVPPVRGPTVFVFLPERDGERAVVRSAHPGGSTAEVHDRAGELLFLTYRLDGR